MRRERRAKSGPLWALQHWEVYEREASQQRDEQDSQSGGRKTRAGWVSEATKREVSVVFLL